MQPDAQPTTEAGEGARRERLLDLTLARLESFMQSHDEPPYRARQVFTWLHQRNVLNPLGMSDLPLPLRALLAATFETDDLKLKATLRSSDGSVKLGWSTPDGNPVEAVMMPGFGYGTAICVSSQSGCPMACKFCETGYMGLRAYLSAGQILWQLYEAEAVSGITADRMVFMGMGEPLLNLRTVRRVIDVLTGELGRGWSPRRITVSTVGLVRPMYTMADTFPRVNLALSLHFTTAEKRAEQMPLADSDLGELAAALYYYRRVNGGKVTIEYTLVSGVNDSDDDARRLIDFAKMKILPRKHERVIAADNAPEPPRMQQLPVHVNLIAYNPIASAEFIGASERRINEFATLLRDAGVPVTVRHSRGQDVNAACGQLGAQLLAEG